MKRVSIVIKIEDDEELEFLKEIELFIKAFASKNHSKFPIIVGKHTKKLNNGGYYDGYRSPQ